MKAPAAEVMRRCGWELADLFPAISSQREAARYAHRLWGDHASALITGYAGRSRTNYVVGIFLAPGPRYPRGTKVIYGTGASWEAAFEDAAEKHPRFKS